MMQLQEVIKLWQIESESVCGWRAELLRVLWVTPWRALGCMDLAFAFEDWLCTRSTMPTQSIFMSLSYALRLLPPHPPLCALNATLAQAS